MRPWVRRRVIQPIYNRRWMDTSNANVPYEDFMAASRHRQRAALAAHTAEAQQKAMDLLVAHLSPAQRAEFKAKGHFHVKGASGKRYRIEKGKDDLVANVLVLDHYRKPSHRLCAHMGVDEAPLGDHLLAQKLFLEAAEDQFLKIANRHAA
jgi:hypothetical protein